MLTIEKYLSSLNDFKATVLIYNLSCRRKSLSSFRSYLERTKSVHIKHREHIGILYLMGYEFNDNKASDLYYELLYKEARK